MRVQYTPFRWRIERREQLGRLLAGDTPASPQDFELGLLRCCARVLALSADGDLVFVGRSPESLYDYLRGALGHTSWAERLRLLPFSIRGRDEDEIRRRHPGALVAMRELLAAQGLSPRQMARRGRPLTLVDLVSSGGTLGNLVGLLMRWSRESRADWPAAAARLRIVGITIAEQPRPRAHRWREHAEWTQVLPPFAIKNVSIPLPLWDFLGNRQEKLTCSHTPDRWLEPVTRPQREPARLVALRRAHALYQLGQTLPQRRQLRHAIAEEPASRERWLRRLLNELT